MLWFFDADSVTFALITISVIATERHTRITYAIAMAKKHIIDMIIRCGMQKTTIKQTKTIKTLLNTEDFSTNDSFICAVASDYDKVNKLYCALPTSKTCIMITKFRGNQNRFMSFYESREKSKPLTPSSSIAFQSKVLNSCFLTLNRMYRVYFFWHKWNWLHVWPCINLSRYVSDSAQPSQFGRFNLVDNIQSSPYKYKYWH